MKKYIHRKAKEKRGESESITFIGVMMALLLTFYALMMATTPFIAKGNLEAFTKTLVREIEIHGAIDDEIHSFAAELASVYNLNPDITYTADYIAGTHQIQIRDQFRVEVNDEVEIIVFDSSFFAPVTMDVPIKDEKAGISEKLWK